MQCSQVLLQVCGERREEESGGREEGIKREDGIVVGKRRIGVTVCNS